MSRSRAPFNTTCSVYHQAAGVVDALPYATDVPCRFVVQDQIAPLLSPLSMRVAWITLDGLLPVGPSNASFGSLSFFEYGDADVLVLAATGATEWYNMLAEEVTPHGEPAYYRLWVAPRWY